MKKFYENPRLLMQTVTAADVIAVSNELFYDPDSVLDFSKEDGNLYDYRDYVD